ncbi:MAG TPA: sugar phosphate isomerase/epimerase [Gemmatimonadales bacterium]|nr:sugar phosphate isomerase/epimerase [Gemmatimonadales bacterium]
MSSDRRAFVGALVAGLGALALPGCARRREDSAASAGNGGNGGPDGSRLDAIGVQLYTLRTLLAKDFEGTLAALARIGYREVEFAGLYDRAPADIRGILDREGLMAPAGHYPLEALRDDPNRTLDTAAELGHRYVVVAWLAEADRSSPEALRRTAELFNRIGGAAAARDLRFAYHNHDFEFAPVGGEVPYDVLLAGTDPGMVWYEMDLFWITKGGKDPLDYFARHPGRFPLVHVKDMAAGQKMVDVGAGSIDWPRILGRREQAGIEHYFVEHDEPADPMASVAASYRYLSGIRI